MAKSFFNTGLLGAAGSSAPSDDQFNRVSFLSHFEGSNNGVNNAFDDGSSSNHTITANGNVTQGSFGPFARPDGEWGVDFEDGDSLAVASSSDFDFGTSNFTWECFVFQKSRSAFQLIMSQDDYSTGNSISCWLTDTGQASIYYEGGGTHFTTTATVPLNTWTHLAWVRKGTGTNEFSIYINGTAEVSGTMTTSFNQDGIIIGQQANGNYDFIGNISNIRIVNGSAVYTGNFTTPTGKLTAVTNTKLLTCQSNRFVDNSASAHTITPAGSAAVTSFGPFLTSSVYDPAVNGASAYFDGNGDYLTIAASNDFDLSDGDITWEFFVYPTEATSVGGNQLTVFEYYSNDSSFYRVIVTNNDVSIFQRSGGDYGLATSNDCVPTNSWAHVAVTRSSNNEHKIFCNGVLLATSTNSISAMPTASVPLVLGRGQLSPGNRYFPGYITDFRLTKGSLVYTSNFTPPTAPLTAITNTQLLLNMADGQAIDSAAQNNLTLFGNANTSTDQAKFNTASLHLDGTGDYVNVLPSGRGNIYNYTVEQWLYPTRNYSGSGNFDRIWSSGTALNNSVMLHFDNTTAPKIVLRSNDSIIWTSSVSISLNAWTHVAVSCDANGTRLYIAGTERATSSTVVNLRNLPFNIGTSTTSAGFFQGYIDDFRISDFARYTSNFTAPSEPFADKGQ